MFYCVGIILNINFSAFEDFKRFQLSIKDKTTVNSINKLSLKNKCLPSCSHSRSREEAVVEEMQPCPFINFRGSRVRIEVSES